MTDLQGSGYFGGGQFVVQVRPECRRRTDASVADAKWCVADCCGSIVRTTPGKRRMTPAELGKVDVLVIGAGNAAANAALSAHEAGASVAMIETAPKEARGGNSAFTGGAFRFKYSSIDELLQLAPDIADLDLTAIDFGSYTEGQYFDDMGRLTEYRCDPELTEVLIGNSFEAGLWLRKHGVRFQPALGRQAFNVDGKFKFWGGLACHILGGGSI